MEKTWIVFGFTVAYIVITTLVGMWSAKYTKDTTSFMTAKNQMPYFLVGILLMSELIGPSSTVGTAQAAYDKGLAVAWNSSLLAVGYLLYAYFIAPKMNALGEYTISGALARHYGEGVRIVVSITMAFALTMVNVAAFTGGGALIGKLLEVSIPTAIYVIGIAASLNVAFGGIRGVGFANIIHTSFKYMGILIVAGTAWYAMHGKPELMQDIPEAHFSLIAGVGYPTLIAWLIGNIGAIFSTQYILQSISGLPSPAEARKAAIVAAIVIFPIGFISAYIGIMAKAIFPDIKSIMALPAFFDLMNPWLVGIVASAMIAATFVTILACQLGATALFMKDFYLPVMKPGKRHEFWATRGMAVVIGLLPIPFALLVPGIIKTLFFARALRTAITVLVIFMLYLPHAANRKAGYLGLVVSVAVTVVWFLLGDPWGIDNIYIALIIPAAMMLIDYAIRKNRQTAK